MSSRKWSIVLRSVPSARVSIDRPSAARCGALAVTFTEASAGFRSLTRHSIRSRVSLKVAVLMPDT